ncbi:early nodulin-like protein 3-like [Hibiscus syriacus]|uniref:Early nodulin-like protein 3-like n=1 Tax=Hibiscus syriacus TaxID=106335 RepID=A0A6A2XNR4_HIBSY|nr:early nodulin-like protein 3-like [Hibiscus syriacus]
MWGAPAEPADYYEPGKTLSVRKWQAAFAPDGQLDISKTLGRIHRGGIHPTIRGEVWVPSRLFRSSEYVRRKGAATAGTKHYEKWKSVCHEIFPVVGSGQFITAPVITEDAGTTTNSTDMVKELSNGPLDQRIINWLLLHQIDRDVGYCQGMSDLASPMIILLENEADAFWCFERMMRRLVYPTYRGNFRCTESSVGVESQLSHLAMVTQVIDPKLHQHLEKLGGGDYLFAVRMLMVLFRREFSFCDSLYLWEMMWALEYDPDLFYLYEEPSSSMNESKMRSRSMRHYGKKEHPATPRSSRLDDVVKILNDITGSLDAKKACNEAIKLHKKYLKKAKMT